MSSSLLPSDNSLYNSVDYWDKRYESVGQTCQSSDSQSSYDWLVDYQNIKHIVDKCVPKSASILMLGCGNSLLSEQMFIDGYHNIHNIDYSSPVIKQMSNHCDNCSQMIWSVMDCLDLKFDDQCFDVVIEKATIDAFLTAEKNPWDISVESRQTLSCVLKEVFRVLKTDGQFISISFFGPHFRYPLYKSCFEGQEFGLSMKAIHELETNFHYYFYHLIKSLDKTIHFEPNLYEPPKLTTGLNSIESNQGFNASIDDGNRVGEENDFLLNINL